MEQDLDLATTFATATWIVRRADGPVLASGGVEFIVEMVKICGGGGCVQWPGTGGVGKGLVCTMSYDVGFFSGNAVKICRACGAWVAACADNCSRITGDLGRLVVIGIIANFLAVRQIGERRKEKNESLHDNN